MDNNLIFFFKWKTTLIFFNGRRPQKNKRMEEDLKKNGRRTPKKNGRRPQKLKMEDDLKKMEDDLKKNGRPMELVCIT